MTAGWIGIDVAKTQLDVVEHATGQHWTVPNTPAGWQQLCQRWVADPPAGIVLEATGSLHVGVTVALDTAALTPVVVNPLTIRRFAQSLGKRGKTDQADAAILARFGAQIQPPVRSIPAETARQLHDVLARHRQLTKLLTSERNRLHTAAALLQPGITAHIAWLRTERTAIDRLLASLVASDPVWQGAVDQLMSVPGIGALTATVIAVGLPELGTCTRQQAAALVGVAPDPQDSGGHHGTRQISGGRAAVRQALYQVMTSAVTWNPVLAAHYRHLRERHKPHKVAMTACMRRLVGLLTAMRRDGLLWHELRTVQAHQTRAPIPIP